MIHHYITEEEIQHLNDLHRVVTCASCKYYHEDTRCEKMGHHVYEDRFVCDQYEQYRRQWKFKMKWEEK